MDTVHSVLLSIGGIPIPTSPYIIGFTIITRKENVVKFSYGSLAKECSLRVMSTPNSLSGARIWWAVREAHKMDLNTAVCRGGNWGCCSSHKGGCV